MRDTRRCVNCGGDLGTGAGHYVPPSLGESGFFLCKAGEVYVPPTFRPVSPEAAPPLPGPPLSFVDGEDGLVYERTAAPPRATTEGPCFVLPDGNCVSPFDCMHGPGINMEELIADKMYMAWIEENLCYMMVRLVPQKANMAALPNDGKGWKNGELRKAISRQMQLENEYQAELDRKAPT